MAASDNAMSKQPTGIALEDQWATIPERFNQFTSGLSRIPDLLSAAGLFGALPMPRRELQPISIQGQWFDAVVDTDAVKCTMSRMTAEQLPGLDLDLSEGQRNMFQLLNGEECWSIGKAKASCRLTRNGATLKFGYTFHIFEEHYVPISLGRELLRQVAPELFPVDRPHEFDDHALYAMDVEVSGVPLTALPDTGSDVNIISLHTAQLLGLDICQPADSYTPPLRGLAGAVVTPLRRVELEWSALGTVTGTFKSTFYVVPDPVQPFDMIIGSSLLHRSGILRDLQLPGVPKHRNSLRRVIRDIGEERFGVYGLRSSFSLTTQRLQCQMNGNHVLANADTGVPMSLVSPEDALQLCTHHKDIRKEDETIELADKSPVEITQSFHAWLTVGTRTVQTRFYILAGIKAPTLSAQVLFELDVFTAHAESFIEVEAAGFPYVLKGGKWRTENKLLGLGRAHVQVLPTIYELVPTDPEFLGKLRLVTAKEDQRRINALEIISSITGGWRQAAEDAERMAVDGFEAEKTRKRAAFERLSNITPR